MLVAVLMLAFTLKATLCIQPHRAFSMQFSLIPPRLFKVGIMHSDSPKLENLALQPNPQYIEPG